ncbi:dentin sialophosphoprotein, partial [Biomphalaria glabrata]
NTALIHSANVGNDVALELLVRNFRRLGLQVDHYNKAGYTALHVAARSGYLQCAKILAIKGKASLTIKDKNHQLTPLEWCLKQGYQKQEVEFLKPSAKFYRLAKLTTTMAKYRKKSTQESLLSSPGSPSSSPQKASEKPKSKMKGFLKKKHSTDDKTDDASNSKGSDSKFFDRFSSGKGDPQSGQKRIWSRSNKQRSFSSSDQPEDVHIEQSIKAALTHSRSHPTESANANGRLMLNQGHVSLSDDFGECDTDDLDISDSDSNIIRFCSPSEGDRSSAIYAEGGVYCGSNPASGVDNSRRNDSSSSSHYTEGGVYCGYTSTSSEASLPYKSLQKEALGLRDQSTPRNDETTSPEATGDIDDDDSSDNDAEEDNDSSEEDEGEGEFCNDDVAVGDSPDNADVNETCLTFVAEEHENGETSKIHKDAIMIPNATNKCGSQTASCRSDSASPVTEIETLEFHTKICPVPESTDSELKLPRKVNLHGETLQEHRSPLVSSASLPLPTPSKGQTTRPEPINSTLHKTPKLHSTNAAVGRDLSSPATEIEYLDLSSSPDDFNATSVSKRTDTNFSKLTQNQSKKESTSSNRDTDRNNSISPITEIEYIENDTIPSKNNVLMSKTNVNQINWPLGTETSKSQGRKLNKTNNTKRDLESPMTEIEYFDWSTPVNSRSCTPAQIDSFGDGSKSQSHQRACAAMTSVYTSDLTMTDIDKANSSEYISEPQTVDSSAASRAPSTDSSEVSTLDNRLTPLQSSQCQSGLT